MAGITIQRIRDEAGAATRFVVDVPDQALDDCEMLELGIRERVTDDQARGIVEDAVLTAMGFRRRMKR